MPSAPLLDRLFSKEKSDDEETKDHPHQLADILLHRFRRRDGDDEGGPRSIFSLDPRWK